MFVMKHLSLITPHTNFLPLNELHRRMFKKDELYFIHRGKQVVARMILDKIESSVSLGPNTV